MITREEMVKEMRKNGATEQDIREFLAFEELGDAIGEEIQAKKEGRWHMNPATGRVWITPKDMEE